MRYKYDPYRTAYVDADGNSIKFYICYSYRYLQLVAALSKIHTNPVDFSEQEEYIDNYRVVVNIEGDGEIIPETIDHDDKIVYCKYKKDC